MRGSERALVSRLLPLPVLVLAALLCGGCRHPGEFVWANAYAEGKAPERAYVVHPGDVLQIRVYNQEAMTTRAKVRADGKISLPFVNDVKVAGLPPSAIVEDLQQRLKDFIVKPTVTVALEETKALSVSILGEVTRPGLYALEPGVTVLHALATAGGFNPYASTDGIYVLRQEEGKSTPVRIRFRYHELIHVEGPSAQFQLQPGDALLVE
jgi:polysaccharide biosynthesis/export protein